jgi:hypothetical protein
VLPGIIIADLLTTFKNRQKAVIIVEILDQQKMKIAVALSLFLAVQPSTALLGIGKLKKVFGKGSMPKQRVTAGGKKLPPLTLDNKDLDFVFAKNQVWKASKLAKDKDFFKTLGTTHTPDYMYIGKWSSKISTIIASMEIL